MTSTFHVVISGWWQDEGEPNGSLRLYKKLCAVRSPTVSVGFRQWNSHWKHQANFITNVTSGSDEEPLVNLYAYSWGAGYGALSLARCLDDRGISVRHAVLCDPVFYHPFPPLRYLWAFLPSVPIRVPNSVKRVTIFLQKKSWLRGHPIRLGKHTELVARYRRDRTHHWMDDDPLYHQVCLQIAGVPT